MGGHDQLLFSDWESSLIERCRYTSRIDTVKGPCWAPCTLLDRGRLMMTKERGSDGKREWRKKRSSDRDKEAKGKPFEPYLWQWRLHRGNITTGCALYLVSSVGGKRSFVEENRRNSGICYFLHCSFKCNHISGVIFHLTRNPLLFLFLTGATFMFQKPIVGRGLERWSFLTSLNSIFSQRQEQRAHRPHFHTAV